MFSFHFPLVCLEFGSLIIAHHYRCHFIVVIVDAAVNIQLFECWIRKWKRKREATANKNYSHVAHTQFSKCIFIPYTVWNLSSYHHCYFYFYFYKEIGQEKDVIDKKKEESNEVKEKMLHSQFTEWKNWLSMCMCMWECACAWVLSQWRGRRRTFF